MHERLQKVLAHAGIASRRASEALITAGKVQVNGRTVTKLGTQIDPEHDHVSVNGKPIATNSTLVYYAVHKPKGVISTVSDEKARQTVLDLVPKTPRVYPVGRLDRNSEGLMILCNDGALANELTHPSFEHEKEYLLEARIVRGGVSQEVVEQKLQRAKKGMMLKDGPTAPAQVEILHYDQPRRALRCTITLHEGRKHQIRRMFEALGMEVTRLVRVRIGKLKLGTLPAGQYRRVEKDDIIPIVPKTAQ